MGACSKSENNYFVLNKFELLQFQIQLSAICPKNLFRTILWSFMKLCTLIKGNETIMHIKHLSFSMLFRVVVVLLSCHV